MKVGQLLLALFFILPSLVFAQVLPRTMTPAEHKLMPRYIQDVVQSASSRSLTPPENPRTLSEWEELQGIVIAWDSYFAEIQSQIVLHASKEVTVYILSKDIAATKNDLNANAVDYSSNVVFVNGAYNSLWIRDYGPNSVYINDVDSLIFVDWIYNRPRYKDDQVPNVLGSYMNYPVYELNTQPNDLVHTGGNFMSNGHHQGFSSRLVLDENGPQNNWGKTIHDEASVDNIMEKFMGISEYIKMENLPFDEIHHIDMHMKLLDEETLIVGEYPDGIADGPQIEANLQYVLNNFKTVYNRPFKVHRVPMPPDQWDQYPDKNGAYRTYANALIVNKTILVPVYEEKYDTTALAVWQKAMPGHKVVGINCNKIIPLSGAIHCITKEIGAANPIWITHKPIRQPKLSSPSDWDVNVTIRHRHPIESAWLMYSVNGGDSYSKIELEATTDNQWKTNLFEATHESDTTMYYIVAKSIHDKQIQAPLTGSNGGGYRYFLTNSTSVNTTTSPEIAPIYPNPSNGITVLPLKFVKPTKLKVDMLDMMGNQVLNIYSGQYSEEQIFFNTEQLPAGSYMIRIQAGSVYEIRKLIVR